MVAVRIGNAPLQVKVGENTNLTVRKAAAAATSAAAAALSEATAESVAGPTYASTAAGLAATTSGSSFAVDNGDGTVTVYLNSAGSAVSQRTLATTDALSAGSSSLVSGEVVEFLQSGSGAVVRTSQAKKLWQVSIEDYGGGPGETAAVNSAAFAGAVTRLNADLGGGEVLFESNGTYEFEPTTLWADNIKLKGRGQTVIKWSALGASTTGLAVTGNNWKAEGIIFEGPGDELTYTANERLVSVIGASSADRLIGLDISRCLFRNSGSSGLYAKWADEIVLSNVRAEAIAHAPLMFFSCNEGRWKGGKIDILDAVGIGGQAYGASLTHDSTGYSADANAGTPLAANPFCNDWVLEDVTVIGPKIWQAIDTHGCYNVSVKNCRTFAAKHGISVTGTSAGDYAGWRNSAVDNIIDLLMPDGTSAGVTPGEALTINGGSTVPNTEVIVTGNRINGYGAAGTSRAIKASANLKRFVISHNIITNWQGVAVLIQTGTTDGVVTENVFGEPTASGAECIEISGAGAQHLLLSGNIAEKGATRQPNIGARLSQVAGSRITVGPNMFDLCATPYTAPASGTFHGPGLPGRIDVTATSGAVTVDCGISRVARGVPINVLFSALSGAITGVTLDNVMVGSVIRLANLDAANTVTFSRSVAALDAAANWVGGQYDTLTLLRQDLGGGIVFAELGRAVNS